MRKAAAQKWKKPGANHVKVNCDAAYDPGTGNEGWGCGLRDSDGDLIKAARGRIQALMNLLQGELITCIQGAQVVIDEGVRLMLMRWCKRSIRARTSSVRVLVHVME